MIAHRRLALVAAWIVSLVVVGSLTRVYGQRSGGPVPLKVFTGEDIGFQVDAVRGRTPLGRFVIRVDGSWVDVQFSGRVIPVK